MIIYRLSVPNEEDEFFGDEAKAFDSFNTAVTEAREKAKAAAMGDGEVAKKELHYACMGLVLSKITTPKLPFKQLAIRLLNRRAYSQTSEVLFDAETMY